MSEQWYSIVEYARAFAISDMTVRRRIKNGKLKAVLKDGKYFIPVGREQIHTSVGSFNAPTVGERSTPNKDIVGKSKQNDMVVVKGNRQDIRIPSQMSKTPSEQSWDNYKRTPSPSLPYKRSYDHIPDSISQGLNELQISTVQSDTLLSFCEKALRDVKQAEKHILEKYENKIYALERALKAKDLEIKDLSQQVEDLQLLVQIFEKKSPKS